MTRVVAVQVLKLKNIHTEEDLASVGGSPGVHSEARTSSVHVDSTKVV